LTTPGRLVKIGVAVERDERGAARGRIARGELRAIRINDHLPHLAIVSVT
jgi:hypothetical protein